MDKQLKQQFLLKLEQVLIYPETVDKDIWQQAEIINQKILNLKNEILEL